jgi:hypothetical protein
MRGLLSMLAVVVLGTSAALAQSFSDPVAYCRAVGTIDKPGARYVGPKMPAWMATKLHLGPSQGNLMEWRCAGGTVLACLYGANIPCRAKAVTDRNPTPAIRDFCRDNPDAAVVPMVVTGHETMVSWACHAGQPAVTKVQASMTRAMQEYTGGA